MSRLRRLVNFGGGKSKKFRKFRNPVKRLIVRLGKRLPTSKFMQLTPDRKLKKLLKRLGFHSDVNMSGDLLHKVADHLEGQINPYSDFWSLTKAMVKQQESTLSTTNVWRVFLWGPGTAKRGRPRSHEIIVGFIMRGGGFGTPREGRDTLALWFCYMFIFLMIMSARKALEDIESPTLEIEPGDDEELQPSIEGPKETVIEPPPDPDMPVPRLGIRLKRPMPGPGLLGEPNLEKAVILALMGMGMSRQGAMDLINGRSVYGSDLEAYRRILDMIFIRCTECGDMIGIDHNEIWDFIILIDDDLISYCTECGTWTTVDVTAVQTTQVFHLRQYV